MIWQQMIFYRHDHLQSHGVQWVYLCWVIHPDHLSPLVVCWHRLNIALVQHMTLMGLNMVVQSP